MILVVRQTLVHLGLREHWEAVRGQAIDALAVLQKADDVVNGDPRTLDAGIAASYVRRPHDVSVGLGELAAHTLYVRGPSAGDQFAAGVIVATEAALPAPLNNPLAPDAGRSRAGALPESIHREIYATLRIPAEVLTPVKTWHRQDE
jgi:hypothetical protein